MWQLVKGTAVAQVRGSTGRIMEIEPADTDGEVGFGMQVHSGEVWAYVGREDRIRLIRWLIEQTPGWDGE